MRVHKLLKLSLQKNLDFCDLKEKEIKLALRKSNDIKSIIDSECSLSETLNEISSLILIEDKLKLQKDLERQIINQNEIIRLEHEEEEEAELEEIEMKRMGAIELITIVGSKGLSAEHVIIIGFDNVNMRWVTKNAFYVAMTRARKSLHILTALKSRGARQPHTFLDQLPDEHIEFYSYTKKDHCKKQLQGRKGFNTYIRKLNYLSYKRRR
jgi:superfamily I DNA/RNA helicase